MTGPGSPKGETTDAVTIIGYHAVGQGPPPITLPLAVFRRQIEALAAARCSVMTVAEVADHIARGQAFPPRAVALTFDDAYDSVHRLALPLLEAHGMRATVYPVTGELGGHNRWDAGRGGARLDLVTATQLLELAAAGWEVGGHTHTHTSLPGRSMTDVRDELGRSKAILEDLCGQRVRSFAYPFGHYDDGVRRAADEQHDACLTIGAQRARLTSSLDRLERVDAWYLQRRWQVSHLDDAVGTAYLRLRRLARQARKLALPG